MISPGNIAQDQPPPNADAKALGAYYTDAQVADFLAWWAIRSPSETVMDPCFGGGVFLRSACKRLTQIGGYPDRQVFGVEIDPDVHRRIAEKLRNEYSLGRERLIRSDFFGVDATEGRKVEAVIGNPPFIRYQRFRGDARKLSLARSLAEGVRLPELCSSWAPFLIHCIAMLRRGGRLAMVLPMEIGHAKYARPVLEHIRDSFGSATFLTFQKKLFPDLSEDTLLLLADEKGAGPARFHWRDLPNPGFLSRMRERDLRRIDGARRLDAEAIASGVERLIEYFIPEEARQLYRHLKRSARAQRLGDVADVGIGYVTGANDFFHLAPEEVRRLGIPGEFLKPVVRRGRALSGLRFTTEDWERAADAGEAGYLLHIKKGMKIPPSVREYIESGESLGIEKAYKCRTRSPWFCVPHVHEPDAFLTYMSGASPRLVANDAGAYAPNSLHVLRFRPLARAPGDVVAALWQTSLTRLSVEIEGHALGGGMLKLEPTEAGNVLIPSPERLELPMMMGLSRELDEAVRARGDEAARGRADAVILEGILGLSRQDCESLRAATDVLRGRRGYGGSAHEPA